MIEQIEAAIEEAITAAENLPIPPANADDPAVIEAVAEWRPECRAEIVIYLSDNPNLIAEKMAPAVIEHIATYASISLKNHVRAYLEPA